MGGVKYPFVGPRGRRKLFDADDMEVCNSGFDFLNRSSANNCFPKVLKSLVEQKMDWYLDEWVSEMEKLTGKTVSIPTLWRSLKYCGVTRKKVGYLEFFIVIFKVLMTIRFSLKPAL